MFGSYFTLYLLPTIMGAKQGKAILSPAASLISLGQEESLHMHILEGEGDTIFQVQNYVHENAREVSYGALPDNGLCFITEQCYKIIIFLSVQKSFTQKKLNWGPLWVLII